MLKRCPGSSATLTCSHRQNARQRAANADTDCWVAIRSRGALVIEPCRWVHTIRMRFPIDVAFLDADGLVVRTVQMPRQRIGLPVPRAQMVIEAEAGAFARWGVHVGDVIELRDDDQ